MATGNDRILAIKKLISLGYEVHFKETATTGVMVISITKDAKEVGFIMDKTLNKKVIQGSAMNEFVDRVDKGWLQ